MGGLVCGDLNWDSFLPGTRPFSPRGGREDAAAQGSCGNSASRLREDEGVQLVQTRRVIDLGFQTPIDSLPEEIVAQLLSKICHLL